ncbi:hypothetical protein ABZ470_26600 [Streptosporangium sp. NPDC020072]|uniref:hypothetical protein n=1 Tax=Streptosporangium sp. NPDC020072 TaxID=3154788 RepID=UPI003435789F
MLLTNGPGKHLPSVLRWTWQLLLEEAQSLIGSCELVHDPYDGRYGLAPVCTAQAASRIPALAPEPAQLTLIRKGFLMSVMCFHCHEPLDQCRRALLQDATNKAVKEIGFAALVAESDEDQAVRVVSAWDAACAVNDLVDLIVAQNHGIDVDEAYEWARTLIEEAASA